MSECGVRRTTQLSAVGLWSAGSAAHPQLRMGPRPWPGRPQSPSGTRVAGLGPRPRERPGLRLGLRPGLRLGQRPGLQSEGQRSVLLLGPLVSERVAAKDRNGTEWNI